MRIAIINSKGGVGKTPLAFSLAKDLGLNLQTNDNSVITQIYDKAVFSNPCKLADNTVNKGDLGTIIEALKGAGFKNDVEYMLLKRSAIFENAIANGMSFAELYNQNGLSRSQYKDFYLQYYKIIEYIKNKA